MDLPSPNFRSSSYFIAQRVTHCPFCGASTSVAAVGLPVDHEVLEEGAENHASSWATVAARALLFFIGELPRSVQQRLCSCAPGFRLARGRRAQDPYWVNRCELCNAVLDDHELHCEPGDTFVPISEAAGSEIRLTEIQESFQARAGGYSLEPQFLPCAGQR